MSRSTGASFSQAAASRRGLARIVVLGVVTAAALHLGATTLPAQQRTITGRVFYNDLRDVGRFWLREEPGGGAGAKVGYSPGATNYLAGLDIVADFYEVDPPTPWIPGCIPFHKVGSATVGFDGVYERTFNGVEGCSAEEDNFLEFAVVFRLRFCNDTRCFSIEDDDLELYTLEHPDAGFLNPIPVPPATTRVMSDFLFEEVPEDVYSKAASLYASMVDTTRVLHVVHDIPIERSEYGEVFVRFPSSEENIASTTSASQIHIPPINRWPKGKGTMHEYGHIVQRRAWGGTVSACSDYIPSEAYDRDGPDGNWKPTTREWPTPAMREGWANYVMRITLEDGTGLKCSGAGFDVNRDFAAGATGSPIANANPNEFPDVDSNVTGPWDGKSYARNVTKLLCDWSDAVGDDDSYMAGDGDHFAASVYSTWLNLDRMWDWVGSQDCLTICDYVDYYVNERKGVAAVGQSVHDDYVALIADLVYNNGLKCDLPNPNTLP